MKLAVSMPITVTLMIAAIQSGVVSAPTRVQAQQQVKRAAASATDRNDGSSGNKAREGVKLPDGESGRKSLPGGSGASGEGSEGCSALYD